MIALSVNLNKIALIRNSRDTSNPDLPEHARMALEAGADGITVHPRPDQRHIRASDCFDLATLLAGSDYADVEFNIEGNPFADARVSSRPGVSDYPGFIELVETIRPAQCTLVPDGDEQLTSDHGFDLTRDGDILAPIIQQLQAMGVRVSLFMDPVAHQIELAAQIGTDRIELYTEPYADACKAGAGVDASWHSYHDATQQATELGLGVNAGHDLDLNNLPRFATIPGLLEVSIGHALTVDSIRMGMPAAIAAYQRALGN
ncbi:pyridoxine 5'-phosphate synthase [Halieaceae bacterium IMCC14734]|uniref:Pyridoxine 5'-phosphate synthase n=1 Tax=Candidatus Litorirhabdus singularis TaxID=2518993 RepID=A0ABT3TIG7_9GAMM|nr:pyridoxine 5'-phosphate synthase [Candidatus Litorirhabdus singularis]MCX2981152.1 pyridoxine 5'-phosphate synthase [Candidatus Litorirhabdus singularis]